MDAKFTAFIVHQVPGRMRFKVPDRRGDIAFFSHLSECLSLCPGISSTNINARTGSVVLSYIPALGIQDIVDYALDRLSLDLQPPTEIIKHSIADSAGSGLSSLDKGLASVSAGLIDVRSILLLMLVVLAVRQFRQGHLAGPVSSLLLSALDITGVTRK